MIASVCDHVRLFTSVAELKLPALMMKGKLGLPLSSRRCFRRELVCGLFEARNKLATRVTCALDLYSDMKMQHRPLCAVQHDLLISLIIGSTMNKYTNEHDCLWELS